VAEPTYTVVKEPYHLGAPQEKLLARSKANAERKKHASNPKGVTPPGLIPFVKGGPRPQRVSVTSRARLNARFLTALADDFEVHGKRAIERMRVHDPSGYIKTVAFLMPKQFEQTTPMQDLTDEELERGIDYLKSKLALSHGTGTGAAPLLIEADGLQTISEAKGIPQSGA
jgi:hypothetical protein